MNAKPHIVILSRAGAGWVGGLQYAVNLVDALLSYRASCPSISYDISVLMSNAAQAPAFERFEGELRMLATLDSLLAPASAATRLRWRLARRSGSAMPWVEDAMARIGASFVYPLRSRAIGSAEWIPDFQHRHFPEGSNPQEIAERKADALNIVAHADRIVLSSYHAERDCHELLPGSISRTRVLQFRTSVPEASRIEDPSEIVRRYHLPERFFLVSNLLAPTKNHALVLDALAQMSNERAHVAFTGDIVDHRNPGFYNGFLAKIHELGIGASVSVLGLIPKDHQTQLLRASLAYVQPSLFEGWHTGVEEAQMLGKPILLSDIPVHREQAPTDARWYAPDDAAQLATLMLARMHDPTPSFDIAREQAAVDRYAVLRRGYAETFLDIAGVNVSGRVRGDQR